MIKSSLEISFDTALAAHGSDLPAYTPQHKFAKADMGRLWRFDACYPPPYMVAVELEGIFSAKSRHRTTSGYQEDCTKYNAAAQLGWTVLRYTSKHLKDNPTAVVDQIRTVLNSRAKEAVKDTTTPEIPEYDDDLAGAS